MTQPENRQAGLPVGHGQTDASEAVAHGDRRDQVHFEDDPEQLARVRHTFTPVELPPQEQSEAADSPEPNRVTDVAEVKPAPSVWDARPREAQAPGRS